MEKCPKISPCLNHVQLQVDPEPQLALKLADSADGAPEPPPWRPLRHGGDGKGRLRPLALQSGHDVGDVADRGVDGAAVDLADGALGRLRLQVVLVVGQLPVGPFQLDVGVGLLVVEIVGEK